MALRKSSNGGVDGQFRIKVRSAGNNSFSGGAAAAHHLSNVDSQYNFDDEQQIIASQSYDDSLHVSMRRKRSGVALLHNLEEDELNYGLITAQIC